jgi:hypothetical protein
MQKTTRTIEAFLDSLPAEEQADMRKLDSEIAKVFKGRERVMWEGVFWGGSEQKIIGYGDYRVERPGKPVVEWFHVGLALQKNYITVYVSAVEGGKYMTEKYKSDLGKAKVGKSTVTFKRLADIDLDKLMELVRKAAAV